MTAPDTGAPLIEGGFTYDSLPDLFRYLCGRGESLFWELKTLAGTFEVTIETGLPVDVILRPQRMVGAKVGVRAAQILFRQQGGRFRVSRNVPALVRPRSLSGTCEHLLIELAALDDEKDAPGARRPLHSVVSDRSADLQLVADLPPIDHQTAFQASSADVPLTDVLQLFSVSRAAYMVSLSKGGKPVGTVGLRSGEVLTAECWPLLGARAFSTLIGHPETLTIDVRVRPLADGQEPGDAPLGTLDALLLREVLSGRLKGDVPPAPLQRPGLQDNAGWAPTAAQVPDATGNAAGEGSPAQARTFWQRLLGRRSRDRG
ncbi:hypothetical protein [Deinococcus altitudinis]|uniref:hypothetical protein n=1 Tax=Deinococcus altitudinis TaxID=468914 RepID=UPI00389133B3